MPDSQGRPTFPGVTRVEVGFCTLVFVDELVCDVPGLDAAAQLRRVLEQLAARMAEAGARVSHLLSTSITLAHAEDHAAVLQAWDAWCTHERVDVRARVRIAPLADDRLVALDGLAAFSAPWP